MDPESGQPRWLAEDPDVYWDVEHIKSHAAVDLKKARDEVGDDPGHTIYLKSPKKLNDEPFWTISEWLDNSQNEDRPMERGAPEGARPPSAEELAEMRERRIKAAEDT